MALRTTHTVLAGVLLAAVTLIFGAWALTDLWRDVFINLGAGLAGAVITFLVFEVYLREIRRSEGLQRKGFEYATFIRNVIGAKEQVRVLTTFTYLFTNPRTRHEFQAALYQALREPSSLSVQILVLDPFSDAARQRHRDRGHGEDVIRLIQDSLIQLFELCADPMFAAIEVRIYDLLPPISLFQWDQHASMSFYPRNRSISEADRFELSMETPLGRFLNETFEAIWKDVATQQLHEYMLLPVDVMNPLTNDYERHRVPYVRHGGAFYLLLNRHRDRWGWSLIMDLPLQVVWKHRPRCCAIAEVEHDSTGLFEQIMSLAVAKYGTFEVQRVVTARENSNPDIDASLRTHPS